MLVFSAYSAVSCMLLDQSCKGRSLEDQEDGLRSLSLGKGAMHASKIACKGQVVCAGFLTWADYVGVTVLTMLQVYCTFLHPLILPTFSFWPLLLTSVSCSVALIWVWADLWWLKC